MEELFSNTEVCFQRYQTAQIILHSLTSRAVNETDKAILMKCKHFELLRHVEKKLIIFVLF